MGTDQENQRFEPGNGHQNHLNQTGQREPLITD
ncbi:hypothetical protein DET64_11631 [Marinobacter nauticus]|jgi:hypothetical protein|uniref:Uncharacterized protein n=1 Tax=Marinobacter nauticus TaxID=2743 RepID=A0A368UQP3_MARNT|nr:hypothetical protein DET64_11631 [Marinobacter nauticus]RCW30340.1 hypothetical protein DET51_11631 [Marinobacter nauticus]